MNETVANALAQRDRDPGDIAERGRADRQTASGSEWRALIETGVGRFKRGVGAELRSRTDRREKTGVGIAAGVLDRALEFGRPRHVRVA